MDSLGQVTVVTAEQDVVSPLLALDGAIAEGVTEGHEDLMVAGIAVVPKDPEVGPGDAETFEGVVGAVRSGHPVDERRRSPADRRGRWLRRRRRLRPRYRLRLSRSPVGLQRSGIRDLWVARG